MNEIHLINYFTKKGFTIAANSEHDIWATLQSKNSFELQFIFFKADSRIYCRLLNAIMPQDIFSNFIIENIEQLDFLISNNYTIRNFYIQHLKESTL